MIVIVEGMDRCGKDTQIKKIREYLLDTNGKSSHVLHYSSIQTKNQDLVKMKSIELYSDMFYILDTAYRLDCYNVICNRAHLGEYVYGHIYRHYNASYIYGIEKLYPFLMENILLFTLVDSSFKCNDRDDGNSLSNGQESLVKQEYDRFIEATELSNINNKLLIDIATNSEDKVWDLIRTFIIKYEQKNQPSSTN